MLALVNEQTKRCSLLEVCRHCSAASFLLFKIRNQSPGKWRESRLDLVADAEVVVAMGHHAKSLGGVDKDDVVGDMCPRLRRGGAANQRGGINPAFAARALIERVRRAAGPTAASAERLATPAARAGVINNRFPARRPRRWLLALSNRTRCRNLVT